MIDGVEVKRLKWNIDERGRLIELVRKDDDFFNKFGQVYLTTAYPGVVKAWHYHKEQVDHMGVIKGRMKIVLYDGRENSPTKGELNEFFSGEYDPKVIRIPQKVYHGFKCVSEEEAFVINTVSEVYNSKDPDEYRLDWDTDKIGYDWSRKNG